MSKIKNRVMVLSGSVWPIILYAADSLVARSFNEIVDRLLTIFIF